MTVFQIESGFWYSYKCGSTMNAQKCVTVPSKEQACLWK